MTMEERQSIINALHRLEVTLGERLARVEERLNGHNKVIGDLAVLNQEVDMVKDRASKLTMAVAVVAILSLGNGAIRIWQVFI